MPYRLPYLSLYHHWPTVKSRRSPTPNSQVSVLAVSARGLIMQLRLSPPPVPAWRDTKGLSPRKIPRLQRPIKRNPTLSFVASLDSPLHRLSSSPSILLLAITSAITSATMTGSSPSNPSQSPGNNAAEVIADTAPVEVDAPPVCLPFTTAATQLTSPRPTMATRPSVVNCKSSAHLSSLILTRTGHLILRL